MFDFTLTLWTQLHQTPFCLRFWEHSRVGKKKQNSCSNIPLQQRFWEGNSQFCQFCDGHSKQQTGGETPLATFLFHNVSQNGELFQRASYHILMKYYKNFLILWIRSGTYFKLNGVNFDFMLTLTTNQFEYRRKNKTKYAVTTNNINCFNVIQSFYCSTNQISCYQSLACCSHRRTCFTAENMRWDHILQFLIIKM